MCSISVPSDLDLWPFDLELALPITPDVGNLFSKFERRIQFSVLELTVGTRQTDGQIRRM